MDPKITAYFICIVRSLSVSFLCLILDSTFGIMYNYAFINNKISLGNVLFYSWFLLSTIACIWYMVKLWSKPFHFEDDNHLDDSITGSQTN
ncbi:MAG: hypothetical protein JST94_04855 [Bacteroidetes bacterium]|nr:hypothetical protein [Bacteroidota bacterium]MBS1670768.1 hypothetical protein [Bacteroidota bacterium]